MGYSLLLISLNCANAWIGVVVSSLSTLKRAWAWILYCLLCAKTLWVQTLSRLSVYMESQVAMIVVNRRTMDNNSDKEKAESMKQRRQRKKERKREIDNEKSRTYYQNHEKEILRKRKDKRLQQDAKPTDRSTLFFPSWMAKKQAVDMAKIALPKSPQKKTEVLAAL